MVKIQFTQRLIEKPRLGLAQIAVEVGKLNFGLK
jgi:hypothetical protein